MNTINFKSFTIGRLCFFASLILIYFIVFWFLPFAYLIPNASMNLGLDTGSSPNDFSQIITNYAIISAILLSLLVIIYVMRLRDCNLSGFISIPIMCFWFIYFILTISPYLEIFPNYKYSGTVVKIHDYIDVYPIFIANIYPVSLPILLSGVFTLLFTLFLFFYPHKEKKKQHSDKKFVLPSLNIPKKKLILLAILALLLICGLYIM